MKAPLFIRPLTSDERQELLAGTTSTNALKRRRCRILLANAEGRTATKIAAALGCAQQTVLNALNAFATEGLACLIEKSHCPKNRRALIAAQSAEKIQAILHREPRDYGKPSGRWTYAAIAEVVYEQGLSDRAVSEETIRQLVLRLGMDRNRGKGEGALHSTSPAARPTAILCGSH